jgi:hypothetical protein
MLPETTGTQVTPFQHYMCDVSHLVAQGNSSTVINNICGSGHTYADLGGRKTSPSTPYYIDGSGKTTCKNASGPNTTYKSIEYKNSDGSTNTGAGTYSYTVGVCPNPDYLMPVSTVQTQLTNFFNNLDGTSTGNGNYFIVSIVPWDATSVQTLQGTDSSGTYISPSAGRHLDDVNVDTASPGSAIFMQAVDRGDRYVALGNLVPNSLTMDIASSDYSPILDAIGDQLVKQKGTFTLLREPTSAEDMIVQILHADGSATTITSNKYTISGKNLIITDLNTILTFQSTDQIVINYQPKTSV